MAANATEDAPETGATASESDTPDTTTEPAEKALPPDDAADSPALDAVSSDDKTDDPGGAEPPWDPGDHDLAEDDEFGYWRPKVSKLAVLALVTGILPVVPVAVISGIAALAGIRRTGRRGHGMAVTALFLAAAWVIVGGAVGTVAVLTHGFQKPVQTIYHQAAVFQLRPGECIDIPNGGQPFVVSCTAPHDAEVFGTFTLPGSAWPGTAAVRAKASARCNARLTAYLNPQLAISLAQTYVYPGQADWDAGTRTVVCEVRAASGQLTQSVRAGSPNPGPASTASGS